MIFFVRSYPPFAEFVMTDPALSVGDVERGPPVARLKESTCAGGQERWLEVSHHALLRSS